MHPYYYRLAANYAAKLEASYNYNGYGHCR